MPRMFSERDLRVFERLRRAFDPLGICNPGKVIPTPQAMRRGARPVPRSTHWRGSGLPSVSSVEEASSLLAAAHTEGRRLRIGDDVRADGMNRILEHDPGDLTCTVEAGVRLSELRASARQQQASACHSTHRAIRRSARCSPATSPARSATASARRATSSLGATLVLADGTIANAGGKVVKNVAGYDLARLVCGSEGRLAPSSRASASVCTRCRRRRAHDRGRDGATRPPVAGTLLASQLQPSALDVLHPGRVAALFEGIRPRGAGAGRDAPRALVGASREPRRRSGTSRGSRQADARRRALRFAPGELVATLEQLDDAIVRPALRRGVPSRAARPRHRIPSAARLFDADPPTARSSGVLAA